MGIHVTAIELADAGEGSVCYHIYQPCVLYKVKNIYRRENGDFRQMLLVSIFGIKTIRTNFQIHKDEMDTKQFVLLRSDEVVEMIKKLQRISTDTTTLTIHKLEYDRFAQQRERLQSLEDHLFSKGCQIPAGDGSLLCDAVDIFIASEVAKVKEPSFPTPIGRK